MKQAADSSARFSFTHIVDFEEARKHRVEWNQLLQASDRPNVYSTWEFFEAWWQAYGSTRHLRLVLGHDERRRLRLVAPLYAEPDEPQVLNVVGTRRADYCQLIAAGGDLVVLRAWLAHMRTRRDWQQLNVVRDPGRGLLDACPCRYDSGAGMWARLGAWARIDQPLVWTSTRPSHAIIRRARFEEFTDLLQRRSHKKHVNWFARQGKVEYLTLRSPAEIAPRLAEFFELHVREWRSRGDESMFLADSNRRFYELMTEKLAPMQALSFDVMLLDGRMVAGHFGFEWGGRFYYLKPCYDPELGSQSPGKLLLAYLLQSMPGRGVAIFDFLNGLEAYKLKYTDEVDATTSFVITRSRLGKLRDSVARKGARPGATPFE